MGADLDEGLGVGARPQIDGADHRRLEDVGGIMLVDDEGLGQNGMGGRHRDGRRGRRIGLGRR